MSAPSLDLNLMRERANEVRADLADPFCEIDIDGIVAVTEDVEALVERITELEGERDAARGLIIVLERDRDYWLRSADEYSASLNSIKANVREIDVAMHGEAGAAKQASACDLIDPARRLRERLATAEGLLRELGLLDQMLTAFDPDIGSHDASNQDWLARCDAFLSNPTEAGE